MRSRLALLSLALLLTACGSDGGGGPQLTAKDFALVKVSGDGQRDTVKLRASSSADRMVGRVAADVSPSPDMFPEALVVKVVPKGASFYRGSLGPTAPSFESAPAAGLPTVTWRVVEEGCGEPFTSAAQPGADSTVATFWVKGTKAGTCHLRAQTVERDSAGNLVPVVQQEFTATQLPGPVSHLQIVTPSAYSYVASGDSIDIRQTLSVASDAYGNDITLTDVSAQDGATIQWGWSQSSEPPSQFEAGWSAVVPDTATLSGRDRWYYREICDDGTQACMKRYIGREFNLNLNVRVSGSDVATAPFRIIFDALDDPTNR